MTRERPFACVFPIKVLGTNPKKNRSQCVPDVPSKMLAPRKDHAAFTIATALKGLCWGLTVSLERGVLVTVYDDDGFRGHIVHDRTRGKKKQLSAEMGAWFI
jgi:hypothetical protein